MQLFSFALWNRKYHKAPNFVRPEGWIAEKFFGFASILLLQLKIHGGLLGGSAF